MTGRYGAASGASSQPSIQALPTCPLALAGQRSGARRVPPPPHGAPCRHRLAELMKWDCVIPARVLPGLGLGLGLGLGGAR